MSAVDCVLKVETKADWGSIYTESTPVPYFDVMSPVDYGHYHDRFLEIINNILKKQNKDNQFLKVVEFGASYGNTTLAYRCGLDWESTGKFWKNENEIIAPIRQMHVTACDMSVPALTYGLRRGVYDRICAQDFNATLDSGLVGDLESSDFLVMIMISSYIKTLSLQRICFNFLGDRSKQKIIAYNDTCAFDSRNLSPECLFAGVKNWTTSTHFNKHRDFTEDERLHQHGCKESWSYTYVVVFEPILVDNVNAHKK